MNRLTAARVTNKAKLATGYTHRWATEKGVDHTFLARVLDAADVTTELRLLNAARDAFRRSGYDATVTSLGGGRKKVTYRLMVTDLDARQESIDRQADARAKALADAAADAANAAVDTIAARHGLEVPSLEEARAEVAAAKGPSPEAVATAVAQFQEELTRNADAIGRILSEPLPGEPTAGLSPAPERSYPPVTVQECEEALAEGLVLIQDGPSGYTVEVQQRASGARLGRVRCITETMGRGSWGYFAAYRPDGSRVGYTKTRVGAASLLLPEVVLTPAVVTLTNPELWA